MRISASIVAGYFGIALSVFTLAGCGRSSPAPAGAGGGGAGGGGGAPGEAVVEVPAAPGGGVAANPGGGMPMPAAPAELPSPKIVQSGTNGIVVLAPDTAGQTGADARIAGDPGDPTIGFWTDPDTYFTWQIKDPPPGNYNVEIVYSLGPNAAGTVIGLSVGAHSLTKKLEATTSWEEYNTAPLGQVTIDEGGVVSLVLKAADKPGPYVMNLKRITLTPVK